jgi:hypothetical protein
LWGWYSVGLVFVVAYSAEKQASGSLVTFLLFQVIIVRLLRAFSAY